MEPNIDPTINLNKTVDPLDALWARMDAQKARIEAHSNGKKVFPIVVACTKDVDESGYITGFAFEPDLISQLRLMDRGQEFANGFSMEACSQVLESLILPGETHELIIDKSGRAMYWKGACFALNQFTMMGAPIIKKN